MLQAGAAKGSVLLLFKPLVEVSGTWVGVLVLPEDEAESGLWYLPQINPAEGSVQGAFPGGTFLDNPVTQS